MRSIPRLPTGTPEIQMRRTRVTWVPYLILLACMGLPTGNVLGEPVMPQEAIIWFDGSRSEAPPPGWLLTDNEDYWGERIWTGVEYRYETEPDKPSDNTPNRVGRVGRKLLNGNRGWGDAGIVGLTGGRPLTVVFDFHRRCEFSEWNMVTPSRQATVKLEVRSGQADTWEVVVDRAADDCPDRDLQRFTFDKPVAGRYARLTMTAPGTVQLREVLAWGTAQVDDEAPEIYTPVTAGAYPVGVTFQTFTGVEKSFVSDRESFYWFESLAEKHRQEAAVWARVATWGEISTAPLLPAADRVNRPVRLVMARNETEAVALALRNTAVDEARTLTVRTGELRDENGNVPAALRVRLGVFGIIGSRNYGNNLGPILEADNMPGRAVLDKYLLNGAEIGGFPEITLPPSGAAVLWLSVTGENIQPGVYTMDLSLDGGERVPVEVEVLDVTLPTPFAHVKTWSENNNRTDMFPFVYADRIERDTAYALDCGLSDWRAGDDFDLVRDMAAARGMRLVFYLGYLIPSVPDYVGMIWLGRWSRAEDLPADAAERIAETVRAKVTRAAALGLDYTEWYGSTGDEPGAKNVAAVAAVCRLIKQADPEVNIYVNPAYWVGWEQGGVSTDATVAEGLEDWYDEVVDISKPLMLLLRDRPRAWKHFSAPRRVNSYYYVSGHLDRSEQAVEIQKYRRMAWNSFRWGFNGWGFYSYYSPRGSAWDHFDRHPPGEGLQEPSDYQVVYPGPRGVIRTRHSEALREGWEDWRLLHMLREQGREDLLAELIAAYEAGAAMDELRLRALRRAAE